MSSPEREAPSNPHPVNLLIVTPSPPEAARLTGALEPLGHRTWIASSCEQALERLSPEELACVLLDVRVLDLECLIRPGARELLRRVPLLLLTPAEREEAAVLRAYLYGRVAAIALPADPDALRARVQELVDIHRRGAWLGRREILLGAASAPPLAPRPTEDPLEHRLGAFLDASPDHIFMVDALGRFTYVNQAAASIMGRPASEIVGRSPKELGFPAAIAGKLERANQRALAGETVIAETAFPGPSGERVFEYVLSPVRDAEGRVTAIAGITRDVHDRKLAEDALRESKELLRATIAALTEGIVLQDVNGVLRLANASAEKLLGLTASQLAGRTSLDPRWRSVHEDGSPYPGEEHPSMVALRTGLPQTGHVMGVHHPDGKLVWLYINAQPLFGPDGRTLEGVVTSFFDVTDQKRGEEERERLLQQLRMAVSARDEFLSVASHELKTPLTPLQLKLQALRREAEAARGGVLSGERVAQALKGVEAQVQRLTGLVRDLLDVSRISRGGLVLKPGAADLARIVRDAVATIGPEAAKRGCAVDVRAPPELRGWWDPVRLEQVLMNLLGNALKYGEGKPVHVLLERDGALARLSVRDEGIGISPEHLERVFGKFERAVSERHYGGLGLGLFISQRIVHAHGGQIRVRSRPGEGSTFTVELPLECPEQEDEAVPVLGTTRSG